MFNDDINYVIIITTAPNHEVSNMYWLREIQTLKGQAKL